VFENNVFDDWLDAKSRELITAMGNGKPLLPEDMMVLVLKAQTNHFSHLDVELRKDMRDLREDMDKRFEENRKDMDKRFEQVDKRFEQVDKRFEQVDKRFDTMISRMDRLMIWSFATTLSVGGMVVAAVKWL
jgi:hypothetical protein